MFKDEYQKAKHRVIEIEKQFNDPKVSANVERIKELTKEHRELKELTQKVEELNHLEKELAGNQRLLQEESDEELLNLIEREDYNLKQKISDQQKEIARLIMPPDPDDSRNVILEIRSGAGGEEAALFAADLFRAYLLFAGGIGWKVEIVNQSRSSLGGLKEVIALITGGQVYRLLKNESGVHRVQRIPATEKSGRVHTSTITVAVLPEAEESDIVINPQDLKVDVFRSSGPGGQSVNTTDSAVRVTHIPSGTVITCQDQKSQHKNKEKALKVLNARLRALEKEKQRREVSDIRSSQIGTGDRSEKIRTYNYPQNRITDHRLKKSWHNLEEIMQGRMGEIIESF
ncbi:MAG: peptide chain release factor 1 [Candidatus Moranbacteria bacterium]|nr:peptide chain release factor 1 [Candidatus Moranbacteria bacterium]